MHTLYAILSLVKHKNIRSPVQQRLLQKLLPLWPALKGSLALVRKPCIRPNCPACARGDKHPNYLLAFTQKGQRRCLVCAQEDGSGAQARLGERPPDRAVAL